MKISDRTLGYLSIVALLLIFVVVAYSMYNAHHEETKTALVDFPELGTLQPEDQVVVRGYTVGTIGSVTWLGDRARVQIKFNEPIILREGSQFNNVNYAIMGQRRLEIIPSKTGNVLPEDYVHTGTFQPGIAEVLRYIENVNEQMDVIRHMVLMIVEGDSTHKSAIQMVENAMTTIEGIAKNVERQLSILQPALKDVFAQIDNASETLIDVTLQADTAIKVAEQTVNEKVQMADSALKVISEGVAHTNEIILSIEQNSLANPLITSTETVDMLNDLLDKLSSLIKAVDTKGIKVLDDDGNPVKLFTWKNTNLIGKTAREKARERAEEARKSSK